jgi:hypothetical protein
MPRWLPIAVLAYLVVFGAMWGIAGAEFLIPALIFTALVLGFLGLHHLNTRRVLARHEGDVGAAMADSDDPIPSVPDIPDDERPLGDTPEAHDEISPHDLPVDHPGRQAAEEQAEASAGEETTGGDERPAG